MTCSLGTVTIYRDIENRMNEVDAAAGPVAF